MSRSSHAILAFLPLGFGVCLLACGGTEGTLVVRHDAAGGAPAMGGTAGAAEKPYLPRADVRWWADLDGPVDITQDAELFYLDAELQDAEDLAALRAQGRHYYCYLSGGSVEDFRDDASEFPPSAVGKALADYPQERWLDVRDSAVRALMARRVTRLSELGCDGVPPSSLAVHAADTGFGLSLMDALEYARWLAERLHAAGMAAGLTASLELTSELWPTFDFGLGISCVEGTGCTEYQPFDDAKKPVLHLEPGDSAAAVELCNRSKRLGFDTLVSDPAFTGRCIACSDLP